MRVSAGPYTLEIPPNGVAILYEADKGGTDHQLPGGVGYLEALVQFAGEVIRLRSLVDQMRKERNEFRARISHRLNDHLCQMTEGMDDSIVGFNEAWDIVRDAFDGALGEANP